MEKHNVVPLKLRNAGHSNIVSIYSYYERACAIVKIAKGDEFLTKFCRPRFANLLAQMCTEFDTVLQSTQSNVKLRASITHSLTLRRDEMPSLPLDELRLLIENSESSDAKLRWKTNYAYFMVVVERIHNKLVALSLKRRPSPKW